MHGSFAIFNVSMWFWCDGKFGKFGEVGGTKHSQSVLWKYLPKKCWSNIPKIVSKTNYKFVREQFTMILDNCLECSKKSFALFKMFLNIHNLFGNIPRVLRGTFYPKSSQKYFFVKHSKLFFNSKFVQEQLRMFWIIFEKYSE